MLSDQTKRQLEVRGSCGRSDHVNIPKSSRMKNFASENINGLGNVAARRASERNGLPEEVDMFGLIGTIIVGFVVGVIAKLIMPGKENMDFIMTTLLGIVGSLAATYIGQAIGWYEAGQGAGWIGSI